MRSFFSTILTWLQWIVGIVPASARRSATLYRVVHYAAVILVTVLLAYFTDRIDALFGDWSPDKARLGPVIARCWWGCLFLLAYAFVRLLVYLITLLRIQEEVEFADIWDAWNDGLQGLEDQRLDFRWLPVFLVNGLSRDEEPRFFQSLRVNWRAVAPEPGRRTSPLRFFANEEAIFVSCTGVGAASAQQTNYDFETTTKGPVLKQLVPERDPSIAGTMAPSRGGGAPRLAAADVGGTLRQASPDEPWPDAGGEDDGPRRTLGATLRRTIAGAFSFGGTLRAGGARGREVKADPAAAVVPLPAKKLDVARRRMRFLCTLIARERSPWCPINGMLQAAPLAWSDPTTNNGRLAGELSRSVAADVETVYGTLALRFPVTYLFTGFESLDGFKEFMERCSKKEPRAGSRFPVGRPVERETASWVVGRVLHWLKGWAYTIFADDLDNPANRQIYYLLCTLRGRQPLLETQVERSFAARPGSRPDEAVCLSGVYLAALGDGTARQAFGRDLLQKLITEQDSVAWTNQLVRHDRTAKIAAYVLFVVAAALFAANALLLFSGDSQNRAGGASHSESAADD